MRDIGRSGVSAGVILTLACASGLSGQSAVPLFTGRGSSGWTTARQNPDGAPKKFRGPPKEFVRRGSIGLQDHWTPAAFGNIRIKVLDQ